MKKRENYQAIRAFADGFKLEVKRIHGWDNVYMHLCSVGERYRIVPDEKGWIPFYPHDEATSPVDPDQMVQVQHGRIVDIVNSAGAVSWDNPSVTRYRVLDVKPEERIAEDQTPHRQLLEERNLLVRALEAIAEKKIRWPDELAKEALSRIKEKEK